MKKSELKQLLADAVNVAHKANTRVASMETATTRMTEAMADLARAKSRAETAAGAAQAENVTLRAENSRLRLGTGRPDGDVPRAECVRLTEAAPQRPWWVKADGTTYPLTESKPIS